MAGSINKVILVGNLGRDPEVRSMQSGDRVANLSVATSDRWRDKQTGEMQERTEWHRVVVFDQQIVDVVENYLAKGRKVYIEGELQTRKYSDQSGVEKYSTEVVLRRFRGQLIMLDSRGEAAGGVSSGSGEGAGGVSSGGGERAPVTNGTELDDDIPF